MSAQIAVSVVVCTYNRQKYIGDNLLHLKQQSISPECYEVLVINNNSTDNTAGICQDFINENKLSHFHYFNETHQGHTYARNRGIKEAKGRLIAFIDDDAMVDVDYVKNIIAFFDDHAETMAIGGKIVPIYEGEPPQWMSVYLLPLVAALDMGATAKPFKGTKFPIGANMAFRESVFEKYGLFDVNLGRRGTGLEGGDEKELVYRLKKDRASVYYVPEVLVRHVIPEKRLQMDYIKGLAEGVAKSEKKRLEGQGFMAKLQKFISESIKVTGTIVLALYFGLKGQFPKSKMLIKFRYWVLKTTLTT